MANNGLVEVVINGIIYEITQEEYEDLKAGYRTFNEMFN